MRRQDKEITDRAAIDRIIARAQVCRLGLCRDNRPYVVPVSFGYDGVYIYVHTAGEGMKIDYIIANNKVCFELEHDVAVVPDAATACKWSFSFYSVMGFGVIEEITDDQSKVDALGQIMKHYSDRDWDLDETRVARTRLWKITIDQVTGKQSADKKALA